MLSRRVLQQRSDRVLFNRLNEFYFLCKSATGLLLPRRIWIQSTAKPQSRHASSSSSTRWKTRQTGDRFAKEAKLQGLKSRAAFKLLEINEKHRIFKPGNTVVDLGYAPGSWSQVAIARTQPHGRVVGIDILPVQPPKGVSTIQGNFLSPEVQAEVRAYVQDSARGRPRKKMVLSRSDDTEDAESVTEGDLEEAARGYIDLERSSALEARSGEEGEHQVGEPGKKLLNLSERDEMAGRVVDVVLSDMSAPWEQSMPSWIRSVSDPYRRMMNTSGISFKDHVGSMDLCMAALTFSFDTLRIGGHFLCKFYQGAEDKMLEKRLRLLFEKVHREKPESSRSESKEGYFLALRRKENAVREDVFAD
ncbi:FtsJ-domain-containing protein [Aulographum hederae CBS 113979]|uniref:rRNA methyltransferase 2, mitochondrial n=1 Tax=Aulographum hederae CBS 113979 TaxID=1176131 RepID=A0A6G1GUD3_9PEZI|nr:FtsJ-domain-containing protein [Aulographum hederae CBS 113979]